MSGKMSRGKCLTTAEIIEECERLSEDDIPDSIYILPPIQTCDETDEDSGDEDDFDPNRLNRNQLTAPAEVRFSDREDRSDDIPHDESASAFKKLKVCEWVHGDISDVESIPVPEEKCFLPPLTISEHSEAIDFLKLFLNEEIVEGLVKHTSMYSSQKNSSLLVNHDDMYAFIGILILSGYNSCPRRRMYWENRADTENALVKNTMRWNQFDELFRHFHACDNLNLDANDKFAKVRPLVSKVNELFIRFAPLESFASIDESMIRLVIMGWISGGNDTVVLDLGLPLAVPVASV
ncbi:piggyBac transposable element-derived protein 3-like [Ischnura elegans]|uniref:piggyBac transposable element-derived protein 3-like n=1 Tax=Ischnura elegans TaxID=197161 RepID=UPI001ED8940B|nr:piggyBac transposable element-derived protein 3-like [Ischnura elegans]